MTKYDKFCIYLNNKIDSIKSCMDRGVSIEEMAKIYTTPRYHITVGIMYYFIARRVDSKWVRAYKKAHNVQDEGDKQEDKILNFAKLTEKDVDKLIEQNDVFDLINDDMIIDDKTIVMGNNKSIPITEQLVDDTEKIEENNNNEKLPLEINDEDEKYSTYRVDDSIKRPIDKRRCSKVERLESIIELGKKRAKWLLSCEIGQKIVLNGNVEPTIVTPDMAIMLWEQGRKMMSTASQEEIRKKTLDMKVNEENNNNNLQAMLLEAYQNNERSLNSEKNKAMKKLEKRKKELLGLNNESEDI